MSSAEPVPHLQVEDLSVHYGTAPALQGVSLAIPDRGITAVIGPSGCGKTTLLRAFNRLLDEQEGVRVSGRVLLDGEDIYAPGIDADEMRRKLGLLSQRPHPLPMSIFDNVAYGPRIHGTRARKALEGLVRHHLEAVGLWEEVKDRLSEPASGLSIGQQQRLCLARGLAVEPEILLADEPTSALDPRSNQRIEELFRQLKARYTIVLVTHILRQARRLADHVVFLYGGELVEHGPAREVLDHPKQELTREYVQGVIS